MDWGALFGEESILATHWIADARRFGAALWVFILLTQRLKVMPIAMAL
jgi:hypothetical protein